MLKQLNRNKKKKGFTLIELVIVLAVLAIIALIAIPNFNKVREDSQKKADDRSLEAIEKVIDMELIEGTISDTASGTLTLTFAAGAATGTLTTTIPVADLTAADVTNIQNNGLNKVKAPQTKNQTAYEVTVANGVINSSTTK